MKTNKTGRPGSTTIRAALTGAAATCAVLAVMFGIHLSLRAQNAGTKSSSSTNIQVSPGIGGKTKSNAPPPQDTKIGVRVYPGGIQPPPAEKVLCMIFPGGCQPPDPQITGVFPFSNLTPGGYVLIFGKYFNSTTGPGGKLQFQVGGTVHDLTELDWSDTAVGGRVPDGWNWPDPQDVDLWLVRADGTRSNNLNPRPQFSPAYEVQMLPGTDLNETHCGGADKDHCIFTNPDQTIDVQHASYYGHDAGTDSYKVQQLRNGWHMYALEFRPYTNHGTVQQPSGFLVDYASMDIQVHWDQDGGSIVGGSGALTAYEIRVMIRGPKGYPWK